MDSAALLNRVDELPRLPKAISELLDAVNDDNATVKSIATKVAHDPLISARVLRLANCAHYGRSREVGTIDEAVVRLGMQTLRTLVLASAVIGAVPKCEGIDLAQFWGQTFEIALYSQEMAKRCGAIPEEAFTCGILHRIGDLLIAAVSPEDAAKIAEAVAQGKDKHEFERELLGYDSPDIGALLAKNWKFTTALVEGILYQDHPKDSDPFSKLAALLCLSYKVLDEWDTIEDDEKTSWLSQLATKKGLRMEMGGLRTKLTELRGSGFEIGRALA
ncbi:putative signal transduction protein [Shewanella baltica OS195]|uniref:Putative signal transduction protein n=1 Tax=Shewanella baltica (strain OS195) TaxID=399599 RepID=A9KU57_SHEB9|nr:HDOD domain-containing protein [Shewanella baltica]ABX51438.1 putative signal transduction protein [Shewanella baltica OS195]ADT96438.1 putative signal transduction protein [Shewanella baltica OS678]